MAASGAHCTVRVAASTTTTTTLEAPTNKRRWSTTAFASHRPAISLVAGFILFFKSVRFQSEGLGRGRGRGRELLAVSLSPPPPQEPDLERYGSCSPSPSTSPHYLQLAAPPAPHYESSYSLTHSFFLLQLCAPPTSTVGNTPHSLQPPLPRPNVGSERWDSEQKRRGHSALVRLHSDFRPVPFSCTNLDKIQKSTAYFFACHNPPPSNTATGKAVQRRSSRRECRIDSMAFLPGTCKDLHASNRAHQNRQQRPWGTQTALQVLHMRYTMSTKSIIPE